MNPDDQLAASLWDIVAPYIEGLKPIPWQPGLYTDTQGTVVEKWPDDDEKWLEKWTARIAKQRQEGKLGKRPSA